MDLPLVGPKTHKKLLKFFHALYQSVHIYHYATNTRWVPGAPSTGPDTLCPTKLGKGGGWDRYYRTKVQY